MFEYIFNEQYNILTAKLRPPKVSLCVENL